MEMSAKQLEIAIRDKISFIKLPFWTEYDNRRIMNYLNLIPLGFILAFLSHLALYTFDISE